MSHLGCYETWLQVRHLIAVLFQGRLSVGQVLLSYLESTKVEGDSFDFRHVILFHTCILQRAVDLSVVHLWKSIFRHSPTFTSDGSITGDMGCILLTSS